MIILAAAVVITLDNSGIINKANEAVDSNNLKQVQQLASLIWADAYLDEDIKKEDITADYIIGELADQGVNTNDYDVVVEENGVTVKKKIPMSTLGELVKSAADYGKTVNYEVTVDGKLHTDWKVFYEDEANNRIFIITEGVGALDASSHGLGDVSKVDAELYGKFTLGQNNYPLSADAEGSQWVAYLLTEFEDYGKPTSNYASYVEGAIGGPPVELFCAGLNAWNESKKLEDPAHTYTEFIASNSFIVDAAMPNDGFYVKSDYQYWLTTIFMSATMKVGSGILTYTPPYYPNEVRPVVCLSSNIPARLNKAGTGFEL